jgi:phospholipid transport system substrate-binding protein
MREMLLKSLAGSMLIGLAAFACGGHAGEAFHAPDALLIAATTKVTDSLRRDGSIARTPEKLTALVESVVLPLFDFRHMTRLAMARDWRAASAAQQAELVGEFTTLLVRTYSNSLSAYADQPIAYRPVRVAEGGADARVRSTIGAPGPQRMTVDYDMEKTPTGWKVYDIAFAGVSLVTTYQSTFSAAVREGGVDGLIRQLSARNRRAAAKAPSFASPAAPTESLLLLHTIAPVVVPAR